ncbi:MAG: AAA family ATPase [Bacteroidia bacterium]
MYIKSVHLENIRCIERLDLAFEEGHEAGWHVLIGENGSGKTTVARAIALGLVPRSEHNMLIDGRNLIRQNERTAAIEVKLVASEGHDQLRGNVVFQDDNGMPFADVVEVVQYPIGRVSFDRDIRRPTAISAQDTKEPIADDDFELVELVGFQGWHFSGFGPIRRFGPGNSANGGRISLTGRADSVSSLFWADASFSEVEPWLERLHTQSLERKNRTLNHIQHFLNDGNLLPNGIRLVKVSSDGIFFEDSTKTRVSLHDLSDGYRSVLSLTFEPFGNLRRYGEEKVFANVKKGRNEHPCPRRGHHRRGGRTPAPNLADANRTMVHEILSKTAIHCDHS